MRILGIDPALGCTGYGLIEFGGKDLHLIEAGIIKTSSRQRMPQRLDKIYSSICSLIKQTKPQVLVLEKLYTHWRHPTTAHILGHPRGIVCLACERLKVPLVEYGVTRVKKAVVGRGNASKFQVQRMVQEFLKLKTTPEPTDVSDALALAIAHGFIFKKQDLNKR
jgi:crossover junction endodeoxyribonuclease RuvC